MAEQPEIAPDRVERAAEAICDVMLAADVRANGLFPEQCATAALVAAGVPELERLHRIAVGLAGSGKLDCLTFDPATDDDACGDCWSCQLWDALAALEPPHVEPEGEK